LKTAYESGGWSRTYGYDRWSNRWVESSAGIAHADSREPTAQSQHGCAIIFAFFNGEPGGFECPGVWRGGNFRLPRQQGCYTFHQNV
jgi:hypothetical protein